MAQQTQHSKKTAVKKQIIPKKVDSKALAKTPQDIPDILADKRHQMIAESAYYIAEQHGFQNDRILDDWVQAESEVDARFAAKH